MTVTYGLRFSPTGSVQVVRLATGEVVFDGTVSEAGAKSYDLEMEAKRTNDGHDVDQRAHR